MIFLNQDGLSKMRLDGDDDTSWSVGQKAMFGALGVYIAISCILVFFHYPISFVSLIIPVVLFLVTTYFNRYGSNEDLIFCTIISVVNALIKLSAIIVYLSAFNLVEKEADPRVATVKREVVDMEPKKVFFCVLFGVETVILLLILFLRCNLRMCRSNIAR